MIFNDLRIQDAILVYLYEHVTDTSCLSNMTMFLRESGEDVTDKIVQRQAVILERKGLLELLPPRDDASLEITGEGCVKAEAVLVDRERVKTELESQKREAAARKRYIEEREEIQRENTDREAATQAQYADM